MNRNLPLLAALTFAVVAAPATAAPKAKLPLTIYNDAGQSNLPYAPSGYMGDMKSMTVNDASRNHPHSGSTCMQVSYRGSQWAGVVWQSPANDWGTAPGGWNLTGAKSLTFWARGAKGGEKVDFKFGLLGAKAHFRDSASGEANVVLTKAWKQYAINLAGKNLKDIKTGFVFVVSAQPTTFFLDDVKYQ